MAGVTSIAGKRCEPHAEITRAGKKAGNQSESGVEVAGIIGAAHLLLALEDETPYN